jgi:hypothetical protein
MKFTTQAVMVVIGFIFKDQPIVIVITSTAYNTPFGHKQADKIMQDYLILAISK